jgi:hypothetical protein
MYRIRLSRYERILKTIKPINKNTMKNQIKPSLYLINFFEYDDDLHSEIVFSFYDLRMPNFKAEIEEHYFPKKLKQYYGYVPNFYVKKMFLNSYIWDEFEANYFFDIKDKLSI